MRLKTLLLLAAVGLGSVAFHGTLRFELQMLDELPMLYLVIVMVYILLERGPNRRFGRWLPWALAAYAVVLTLLCSGSRGRLQFYVFQVSFGSLEVWSLVRVSLLWRASHDPAQRRLFRLGVAAYGLGVLVWFSDIRFCYELGEWLPRHGVPNPQLHAWWHVLVSCGFYALLTFIARAPVGAPSAHPKTLALPA